MKRMLRESPKMAARRRRPRRRAPGAVLTFAPQDEFDSAVLFTEADASHEVRTYPDALGTSTDTCSTRDTCILHPL